MAKQIVTKERRQRAQRGEEQSADDGGQNGREPEANKDVEVRLAAEQTDFEEDVGEMYKGDYSDCHIEGEE